MMDDGLGFLVLWSNNFTQNVLQEVVMWENYHSG